MPGSRGQQPTRWKTGPDRETHRQFVAWHRQRAQANYRDEGWLDEFDFASWQQRWGDLFAQRGRGAHQLCMSRLDRDLPWSFDNTEVLPRNHQLKNQPQRTAGYLRMKRAKVPDTL
tara:strand:+ start:1718 stop:2065 length:348 start_codon:yes stop_codon:yes gene_type:complete